MSNPCAGCAFTEGSRANLEPDNHLRGILCLLGPIPFYCHHLPDETDIHDDPKYHQSMTKKEFRGHGMVICGGWKREVRELAATGYYRERPMITRAIAVAGHDHLSEFLSAEEGSEDKLEAQTVLGSIVKQLGEKRRRFESSCGD